ncbi:uncharacterized protein BDR25DRAFT_358937 [Lindgomyces ingoldianus]|uniref:Uncharacterized protein n=1 Tax=Lindgomyces ingoldianus TaxID=673940 RepID=A0ACB6QJ38_9PLEO|nr:uncharacterized protein BDR25DRAFT_358937 [Lindgomyces ingoldianus]KAF2466877.1 hypothetical protein BDR25DRAFT_358937 [Lindgomyces ingoldianus]
MENPVIVIRVSNRPDWTTSDNSVGVDTLLIIWNSKKFQSPRSIAAAVSDNQILNRKAFSCVEIINVVDFLKVMNQSKDYIQRVSITWPHKYVAKHLLLWPSQNELCCAPKRGSLTGWFVNILLPTSPSMLHLHHDIMTLTSATNSQADITAASPPTCTARAQFQSAPFELKSIPRETPVSRLSYEPEAVANTCLAECRQGRLLVAVVNIVKIVELNASSGSELRLLGPASLIHKRKEEGMYIPGCREACLNVSFEDNSPRRRMKHTIARSQLGGERRHGQIELRCKFHVQHIHHDVTSRSTGAVYFQCHFLSFNLRTAGVAGSSVVFNLICVTNQCWRVTIGNY